MLKLHLLFITVSISVRKPDTSRFIQMYENDLRIRRIIEENQSKRDEHLHLL